MVTGNRCQACSNFFCHQKAISISESNIFFIPAIQTPYILHSCVLDSCSFSLLPSSLSYVFFPILCFAFLCSKQALKFAGQFDDTRISFKWYLAPSAICVAIIVIFISRSFITWLVILLTELFDRDEVPCRVLTIE